MVRIAAVLTLVVILALYGTLAYQSPLFNLLSPRGGILTLGVSLLLAIAAIWISQQPDRKLNERVQLLVAGWIWLLVQLGCILYLLYR